MTYKEHMVFVAGKEFPGGGVNDEGENVIIEHEQNDDVLSFT